MALDSSKVRVGVTGSVSVGAVGATAPTGTASAITGFTDVGWIGEDGVTASFPGGGDADRIVGWQNGGTVRIIRTPSEDNPTLAFVMLETKKETVETALGVTVTTASTEGSYEFDTQDTRVGEGIRHRRRGRRRADPQVRAAAGSSPRSATRSTRTASPSAGRSRIECERTRPRATTSRSGRPRSRRSSDSPPRPGSRGSPVGVLNPSAHHPRKEHRVMPEKTPQDRKADDGSFAFTVEGEAVQAAPDDGGRGAEGAR